MDSLLLLNFIQAPIYLYFAILILFFKLHSSSPLFNPISHSKIISLACVAAFYFSFLFELWAKKKQILSPNFYQFVPSCLSEAKEPINL